MSAVNGSAGNVGNSVAGTYGSLNIASNGSYTYTANAAYDALAVGQSDTDVFSFTVSDGHGGTVTRKSDLQHHRCQ